MSEQIFKIDRAKWLAGHSSKPSMMCDSDGNKCCLGFITHQAVGCEEVTMLRYPTPGSLLRNEHIGFSALVTMYEGGDSTNSYLSGQAMKINDNPNLSKEERESSLIQLFNEHGIKIEFHGEYPNE